MPTLDRIKLNRRKHYQKNKDKIILAAKYYQRMHNEWFESLKSDKKCLYCGEDHIATLVFHHRNPDDKTDEVSHLVAKHANKEKILKEIEKCDVLCSNCHSKLHWKERKDKQSKDAKYQQFILRLKENRIKKCRDCSSEESSEVPFRKNRRLCLECYNKRQKHIMCGRRE